MARDGLTVIFDLGETLVDETRQWTVAAHASGVPLFTLCAAIGSALERGLDHWQAFADLGVPRVIAGDHGYVVGVDDFYPDALPAIATVKAAGYRVGIVANQPDGVAAQLEALALPLDVIATSATYGVAKPDPAFFRRIVDDCDVPADRIVYIGDRLDNDILPALGIGMQAVFLRRGPWGLVQSRWPAASTIPWSIDTLGELPAVLERLWTGERSG